MVTIIFAGFGVWNSTIDVTALMRRLYAQGTQTFTCDDCKINGHDVDDPSPGNRKYLFVIYSHNGHAPYGSATIGESDPQGFTLPIHAI